jgi:hypothetical protein
MPKMSKEFLRSTSRIINSYCDQLENSYSKCKNKLSKEKSKIPFEKQIWTAFQITMLSSLLAPMDLFKYLIEIGFIDNKNSSLCPKCGGSLTLLSFNNFIKILNIYT